MRTLTFLLSVAGLLVLGGCAATASVSDFHHSLAEERPVQIKVESCIDRTAGNSSRDLGLEATAAFIGKLKATGLFEVNDNGRYVLTCDITAFVPGSALKRWLMPGWGATVGQVAVLMMDSKNGEIIAIVRGNATVASGGLYSVGADQYILASALDDLIRQFRELATGTAQMK